MESVRKVRISKWKREVNHEQRMWKRDRVGKSVKREEEVHLEGKELKGESGSGSGIKSKLEREKWCWKKESFERVGGEERMWLPHSLCVFCVSHSPTQWKRGWDERDRTWRVRARWCCLWYTQRVENGRNGEKIYEEDRTFDEDSSTAATLQVKANGMGIYLYSELLLCVFFPSFILFRFVRKSRIEGSNNIRRGRTRWVRVKERNEKKERRIKRGRQNSFQKLKRTSIGWNNDENRDEMGSLLSLCFPSFPTDYQLTILLPSPLFCSPWCGLKWVEKGRNDTTHSKMRGGKR